MQKAEEYTSKIIEELNQELTTEDINKIEKNMLIAAKIDDILKSNGWDEKDLAHALCKTPSEINKWLSGTHNFTIDNLKDLEVTLGVTF